MSMSIVGVDYYLPERVVSNDELLHLVAEHSGMEVDFKSLTRKLNLNKAVQRHFKAPDETGLDMATAAALKCLRKADFDPLKIDMILYAGMLRDFVEPPMGVVLQKAIGAENANAFDISNACNGFLNSMEMAKLYIESGRCKTVMIVGAEDGSERIPWEMFASEENFPGFTALTVSDGAAAMILQKSESPYNFKLMNFKTFGEYHDICRIKIGKEEQDLKLMVNSKKMAKVAVELLSEFIPDFVLRARDFLGNLDHIFFHQVTGDLRKFCGNLSDEYYDKAYQTFWRVGNTGSISIPLGMALAEEDGKLKRGDYVATVVGASGFSYGGTAFIY